MRNFRRVDRRWFLPVRKQAFQTWDAEFKSSRDHVGVAQMVEQWIVDLLVASSILVSHLMSCWLNWYSTGLANRHSEKISEFESQAWRYGEAYRNW